MMLHRQICETWRLDRYWTMDDDRCRIVPSMQPHYGYRQAILVIFQLHVLPTTR
jgi:hypothetical protein